MDNVIDLASVRAARAATLRRAEPTDIISIGVSCDFDAAADVFKLMAEARCASGIDVDTYPVEMALGVDGNCRVSGSLPQPSALALRDECKARGLAVMVA